MVQIWLFSDSEQIIQKWTISNYYLFMLLILKKHLVVLGEVL